MGFVRDRLSIWLHYQYCLLIRDHMDTADRVLCKCPFLNLLNCLLLLRWNIDIRSSFAVSRIIRAFKKTVAYLTKLAHRLFAAAYYSWIAGLLPIVRGYMVITAIMVVIPSALWIASIHVEYPSRLGLVWIAIALGKG